MRDRSRYHLGTHRRWACLLTAEGHSARTEASAPERKQGLSGAIQGLPASGSNLLDILLKLGREQLQDRRWGHGVRHWDC